MSETYRALGELRAMGEVLARKVVLPDIPLCLRQANSRPSHDGAVSLPPEKMLEAIKRELHAACQSSGGAKSLSSRILRNVPLVLWKGEPQAASFRGLLEAFPTHAASKPKWQRDLIEAWLRDFGQDRVFIYEIGNLIARFLAEAKDPKLMVWRDVHATYHVFDNASGPANVGRVLLTGPGEISTILHSLGMDDQLRANGGFFRSAVGDMLRAVPKLLRAPNARAVWTCARTVLEVAKAPTGQIALRSWSDRVIGLGLWERRVLPWIALAGNEWFGGPGHEDAARHP